MAAGFGGEPLPLFEQLGQADPFLLGPTPQITPMPSPRGPTSPPQTVDQQVLAGDVIRLNEEDDAEAEATDWLYSVSKSKSRRERGAKRIVGGLKYTRQSPRSPRRSPMSPRLSLSGERGDGFFVSSPRSPLSPFGRGPSLFSPPRGAVGVLSDQILPGGLSSGHVAGSATYGGNEVTHEYTPNMSQRSSLATGSSAASGGPAFLAQSSPISPGSAGSFTSVGHRRASTFDQLHLAEDFEEVERLVMEGKASPIAWQEPPSQGSDPILAPGPGHVHPSPGYGTGHVRALSAGHSTGHSTGHGHHPGHLSGSGSAPFPSPVPGPGVARLLEGDNGAIKAAAAMAMANAARRLRSEGVAAGAYDATKAERLLHRSIMADARGKSIAGVTDGNSSEDEISSTASSGAGFPISPMLRQQALRPESTTSALDAFERAVATPRDGGQGGGRGSGGNEKDISWLYPHPGTPGPTPPPSNMSFRADSISGWNYNANASTLPGGVTAGMGVADDSIQLTEDDMAGLMDLAQQPSFAGSQAPSLSWANVHGGRDDTLLLASLAMDRSDRLSAHGGMLGSSSFAGSSFLAAGGGANAGAGGGSAGMSAPAAHPSGGNTPYHSANRLAMILDNEEISPEALLASPGPVRSVARVPSVSMSWAATERAGHLALDREEMTWPDRLRGGSPRGMEGGSLRGGRSPQSGVGLQHPHAQPGRVVLAEPATLLPGAVNKGEGYGARGGGGGGEEPGEGMDKDSVEGGLSERDHAELDEMAAQNEAAMGDMGDRDSSAGADSVEGDGENDRAGGGRGGYGDGGGMLLTAAAVAALPSGSGAMEAEESAKCYQQSATGGGYAVAPNQQGAAYQRQQQQQPSELSGSASSSHILAPAASSPPVSPHSQSALTPGVPLVASLQPARSRMDAGGEPAVSLSDMQPWFRPGFSMATIGSLGGAAGGADSMTAGSRAHAIHANRANSAVSGMGVTLQPSVHQASPGGGLDLSTVHYSIDGASLQGSYYMDTSQLRNTSQFKDTTQYRDAASSFSLNTSAKSANQSGGASWAAAPPHLRPVRVSADTRKLTVTPLTSTMDTSTDQAFYTPMGGATAAAAAAANANASSADAANSFSTSSNSGAAPDVVNNNNNNNNNNSYSLACSAAAPPQPGVPSAPPSGPQPSARPQAGRRGTTDGVLTLPGGSLPAGGAPLGGVGGDRDAGRTTAGVAGPSSVDAGAATSHPDMGMAVRYATVSSVSLSLAAAVARSSGGSRHTSFDSAATAGDDEGGHFMTPRGGDGELASSGRGRAPFSPPQVTHAVAALGPTGASSKHRSAAGEGTGIMYFEPLVVPAGGNGPGGAPGGGLSPPRWPSNPPAEGAIPPLGGLALATTSRIKSFPMQWLDEATTPTSPGIWDPPTPLSTYSSNAGPLHGRFDSFNSFPRTGGGGGGGGPSGAPDGFSAMLSSWHVTRPSMDSLGRTSLGDHDSSSNVFMGAPTTAGGGLYDSSRSGMYDSIRTISALGSPLGAPARSDCDSIEGRAVGDKYEAFEFAPGISDSLMAATRREAQAAVADYKDRLVAATSMAAAATAVEAAAAAAAIAQRERERGMMEGQGQGPQSPHCQYYQQQGGQGQGHGFPQHQFQQQQYQQQGGQGQSPRQTFQQLYPQQLNQQQHFQGEYFQGQPGQGQGHGQYLQTPFQGQPGQRGSASSNPASPARIDGRSYGPNATWMMTERSMATEGSMLMAAGWTPPSHWDVLRGHTGRYRGGPDGDDDDEDDSVSHGSAGRGLGAGGPKELSLRDPSSDAGHAQGGQLVAGGSGSSLQQGPGMGGTMAGGKSASGAAEDMGVNGPAPGGAEGGKSASFRRRVGTRGGSDKQHQERPLVGGNDGKSGGGGLGGTDGTSGSGGGSGNGPVAWAMPLWSTAIDRHDPTRSVASAELAEGGGGAVLAHPEHKTVRQSGMQVVVDAGQTPTLMSSAPPTATPVMSSALLSSGGHASQAAPQVMPASAGASGVRGPETKGEGSKAEGVAGAPPRTLLQGDPGMGGAKASLPLVGAVPHVVFHVPKTLLSGEGAAGSAPDARTGADRDAFAGNGRAEMTHADDPRNQPAANRSAAVGNGPREAPPVASEAQVPRKDQDPVGTLGGKEGTPAVGLAPGASQGATPGPPSLLGTDEAGPAQGTALQVKVAGGAKDGAADAGQELAGAEACVAVGSPSLGIGRGKKSTGLLEFPSGVETQGGVTAGEGRRTSRPGCQPKCCVVM